MVDGIAGEVLAALGFGLRVVLTAIRSVVVVVASVVNAVRE